MIEPKIFYRQLDNILAQIDKQKSDKNFFVEILNTVQREFGRSLSIQHSHIYERRGDDFEMIGVAEGENEGLLKDRINGAKESIQQILRKGNLILDTPELREGICDDPECTKITPAAILVQTPVRQWLAIFELDTGWVREEINLFLNAMRTALNYRLFSDMMKLDLIKAEQIQRSLLPKTVPNIPGYDIYGFSRPAEYVGGDFYEYFQFSEEDFGVAIGDASGHGMPAALLVRDVVIGLRMGLAKEMRLVHTLRKLNEVIQKSTYSTNFVSMFVGEIESDGHLFYVNAGHPPPFLVCSEESCDLEATGITLGFVSDIELRRAYIRMDRGAILVLYTDGIVERQNREEEQYGVERLKELVTQNRQQSAEEIVKTIYKQVYQFGGKSPWEDDASVVIIKRNGKEKV
jgi:sigma-B regulation protein RsbU (phosphoserine phosphatase)